MAHRAQWWISSLVLSISEVLHLPCPQLREPCEETNHSITWTLFVNALHLCTSIHNATICFQVTNTPNKCCGVTEANSFPPCTATSTIFFTTSSSLRLFSSLEVLDSESAMPQLRFLQLPRLWLPVKLRYYEPNFKALLYQNLAHVSPCEILNWLNPSTLILPQRHPCHAKGSKLKS